MCYLPARLRRDKKIDFWGVMQLELICAMIRKPSRIAIIYYKIESDLKFIKVPRFSKTKSIFLELSSIFKDMGNKHDFVYNLHYFK